jgi:acyl transferase domain-containing protein/acyl carrier protein
MASRIEAALAQLQDEVSNCQSYLLKLIQVKKMMSAQATETNKINTQLQQTPIAIIGMASIFPESKNLQEYWEKIIRKTDCITDVPTSRWNVEDYYDPDPKAPDKTYCKRGGFIPDIDFNPMEFGLPPNLLEVTDVSQLLSLVVAKAALEDAGYDTKEFNRERTGVILGVALAKQLTMPLAARLQYPIWEKALKSSGLSDEDTQKVIEKIKSAYVQWNENAFPGMLANVVSGRIANRFDLGGMNCVVDAACASSLGALSMAISQLVEHRADMMLTGGVDTDNSIVAYMCFSKTPAVSRSQNTKPFDADSDGMMLAEGIGMLLLKRLADAERDNDKIYAVIKGIGTSSDGKYKSIYAPRPEGQVKALRRAYEDAGFSPTTVGLIEAHGTGTMVGDPAEFSSIKEVFGESNSRTEHIALGSVKSQIGHAKAAAGAASLIKTALALHHKVLPPTINVTKPHSKLDIENSPFYLNTETRPWIQADAPRRAGVSSFGFGGTNYHIVLEEYCQEHDRPYRLHNTAQPLLVSAPTFEHLLSKCEEILTQLQSEAGEKHYAELISVCKYTEIPLADARVGFVADSLPEACKLLKVSIEWLRNKSEAESWEHPQGIYFRKTGISLEGKVVALFSGQGSQYLEMGRELVINFPSLQQTYSTIDRLLSKEGLKPVSEVVFPHPVFDPEKRKAQEAVLEGTEYAQPAIGTFSVGLYKIFKQTGFKADFVAGHSFGELTALWAAEVLSEDDYFFLVKTRAKAMAAPKDSNYDTGTMLAVKGDVSQVEEIVKNFPGVAIANRNSPRQIVLAGAKAEIANVQEALKANNFSTVLLKVSAAFHTPLVAHAQQPFAHAVEEVNFNKPKIPVYTNLTGEPYPTEPQAIQKILKQHLINHVLFQREIENIYSSGGYCFVEFGPRSILTNLVKDILGDKPHLAIATNSSSKKDSDRSLREVFVQLRVAGLPLKNLDPYQLEQKTPDAKNQLLNVRLNGSNYVSEKTKEAFEQALENGHQITTASKQDDLKTGNLEVKNTELSVLKVANATMISCPINDLLSKPSPRPSDTPLPNLGEGKGVRALDCNYSNEHDMSEQNSVIQFPKQTTPITTLQTDNNYLSNGSHKLNGHKPDESSEVMKPYQPSPVSANSQRILDSLEYTLIEFNRHQRDILNVHQQSLQHQTEYAKTFFQLIQQQNELLGGKFAQQVAETKQLVVSSSERSMMRFHDHQAETLRIHEQYLNHQTEYTKNFFQLIQQQYGQLITGDVTNQRALLQPQIRYQDIPAPSITENKYTAKDNPVLVGASVGISSNGIGNGSKNGGSNGSKNGASNGVAKYKDDENKKPVPPLPTPTIELEQTKIPETEISIPQEPAVSVAIPATIDQDTLSQTLLTIVSDKTGYPMEMLELSMDIEADLGIDSIKRVEILGALLELYPELPKPNPEELAQLRTLGQIAEYIPTLLQSVSTVQPQNNASEVSILPASELEWTGTMPAVQELASTNTVPTETSTSTESIAKIPIEELIVPVPDIVTPAIDLASLNDTLLTIVSDKTGYPVEMLELSMDVEADLGIDSIKRVEILGALLELYPDLPKPNPEELAELRTLGQIVDYMAKQGESAEKKTPTYSQQPELSHNIERSPVRVKVIPEPDVWEFTLPDKHIALITDDGSLTTTKLAETLVQRGLKVVVLSFPQVTQLPLPEGIERVVLADWTEEHLQQQLSVMASKYGAIAEFIHLHPDVSSADQKALLRQVFLVAKHLKEPLNQAASQGHSCFLTVARLDGELGLSGKTNFNPISGGLFGLTKTLNQEWEAVHCRAIDLSPDLDVETSVKHILAELHDPNRLLVEVGYGSQGRVTLSTPLLSTEETSAREWLPSPTPPLSSQVFLVSGGAKGITAQCVIKLAQQYKCKFILLGRSAAGSEPVWAEGCDEAQLKKLIMEVIQAKGEKPTPIMVQREFNAISSKREIKATLQAIEQAGGQAEYLSADVTDATLVEQLAPIVERLGKVTGIIHGAGNLADKRIEKKSERDFETVYNPKVQGLENLLRCVPPSQLNYLVLFSSVVGFYGNVGQSDYAIANEILSKTAHLVKRNHPDCHVVAINWGPWDSGMVSPELKKAFAERNIETISIEVGTQMLVEELAIANQDSVQVLIGSPLVYTPESLPKDLKSFRIQRSLKLAGNPFLQDHVIGGNPVLPATCAIAWIANTCEQLYPGYKFFSCPNFKVLKGIILDGNQAEEYTLDLQEIAKSRNNEIEFEAKIWSNNSGKVRYHFSTQLKLKRQIPIAPTYEPLLDLEATIFNDKTFYQNGVSSLFHGQCFQGVKNVLNISPEKITIECILPNCGEQQQGQFPVQTFNPYIVDVHIHSLWIWTQHFYQEACLPSEIKNFEQFLPIPFGETFYISCEIKSKTDSAVVGDVIAHDKQGRIYSRMMGAKGTVLPGSLVHAQASQGS